MFGGDVVSGELFLYPPLTYGQFRDSRFHRGRPPMDGRTRCSQPTDSTFLLLSVVSDIEQLPDGELHRKTAVSIVPTGETATSDAVSRELAELVRTLPVGTRVTGYLEGTEDYAGHGAGADWRLYVLLDGDGDHRVEYVEPVVTWPEPT